MFIGVLGATRSAPEAKAETRGVSIKNFAFAPATVNARVGESVRWINDEDAVPHTVTSETFGTFNSSTVRPGDSFSQPFTAAGAYQYFCQVHPRMRGVVLVGEATGAPSTPWAVLPTAPISLRLSGANEVPAVTTPASGAFTASAGANSLAWQMQLASNGILVAHIHSGAAGTNGPVVAFLYGPATGKNLIEAGGTLTVDNLVGPMAGNWKAFSDAFAAGTLYVNAHSAANPGGEIRAQIPAPPRPPATGTGTVSSTGSDNRIPFALLAASLLVFGGSATYAQKRRSR
jgi:plastocyanin